MMFWQNSAESSERARESGRRLFKCDMEMLMENNLATLAITFPREVTEDPRCGVPINIVPMIDARIALYSGDEDALTRA